MDEEKKRVAIKCFFEFFLQDKINLLVDQMIRSVCSNGIVRKKNVNLQFRLSRSFKRKIFFAIY